MTAFPYSALPTYTSITISLNSLANGSLVLGSTVIDNSDTAARWDRISVEVSLGSFTPTANGRVEGWLIGSPNGSYVSLAGAVVPLSSSSVPYGSCALDTGAGAKIAWLVFDNLMPVPYKLLLLNSTGAAFASSGHTVKWAGTVRETR